MRLKIRCDGWKRKYFGFAWEVNMAAMFQIRIIVSCSQPTLIKHKLRLTKMTHDQLLSCTKVLTGAQKRQVTTNRSHACQVFTILHKCSEIGHVSKVATSLYQQNKIEPAYT
jgi:CRISPR/Cas system CMR-associated protein Cmr1 (group 7 of RAMP superfamily)